MRTGGPLIPSATVPLITQATISSCPDELDGGFSHRSGRQGSAHLQIVRHDQIAVSDSPAKDVGNPNFRQRGRCPIGSNLRIRRVRDHRHRQLLPERAVREQVFCPKVLQWLLYDWQPMMTIELALAESRKMLAAAQHPSRTQAGEKLASVGNRFSWVLRD